MCTTAPKEHSVALSAADHWSEPHSEDSSVDCIPGKAEINKQVSCEDLGMMHAYTHVHAQTVSSF